MLRFIPENSLVEITTRTLQGRLLLRPSPELTDLILGIVGTSVGHSRGCDIPVPERGGGVDRKMELEFPRDRA
jgi:hypothetical protein